MNNVKNATLMDSPVGYNHPCDLSQIPPHKVTSTGTIDLWRDGLLCAYEFVPAPEKKFKVGGDFGAQNGTLQGRFDAEIMVKQQPPPPPPPPHQQHHHVLQDAEPRMDSSRSHVSVGRNSNSEDLQPGSPPEDSTVGSLGTEVQGFVVRESLHRGDDATQDDSPSSLTAPDGLLQGHPWAGKKDHNGLWVPIGWSRLIELFQSIQVSIHFIFLPCHFLFTLYAKGNGVFACHLLGHACRRRRGKEEMFPGYT